MTHWNYWRNDERRGTNGTIANCSFGEHGQRLFTAILCLPLFCLLTYGFSTSGGELRAGLARVDITPERPVTMAGYESRKDLSQGVHDPLSARAVAFEKDGDKLVLVSTDILGFYGGTADRFRQAILDGCGLKPSELFLCAIHTHSAPTMTLDPARGHSNNVQYATILQSKLVRLTREAFAELQPVRLGFGAGSSPVGVNRREVVQDADGTQKVVLGRNPSKLTDREVQVLKLVRPGADKLAGVLFAYATHSTSLGPRNYLISGDIHGLAEQLLERYFGADVVAPGFAGASGNLDPWVRVLPDFRTNNGWMPEPVLMGTMLGEEVARVADGIRLSTNQAGIKTALKVVELPAKARGTSTPPTNATSAIVISAACLGDIAFVGWGGEVFNEIGQSVKTASPFRRTFIFTHCNGTAGYVPTHDSYPEGGYEVQSSSFAPGAGEQLAEETLRLLRNLKEFQPR
ncbi:MAG TPA: neutral/alkaline non-lysosomal ceramidase N-terminal domain-containing protein [Verrucomicrobiae bacterium]